MYYGRVLCQQTHLAGSWEGFWLIWLYPLPMSLTSLFVCKPYCPTPRDLSNYVVFSSSCLFPAVCKQVVHQQDFLRDLNIFGVYISPCARCIIILCFACFLYIACVMMCQHSAGTEIYSTVASISSASQGHLVLTHPMTCVNIVDRP